MRDAQKELFDFSKEDINHKELIERKKVLLDKLNENGGYLSDYEILELEAIKFELRYSKYEES